MKRMKKFLAVLLAAVMVMAMGSVSVFADGTVTLTVTGSTGGKVTATDGSSTTINSGSTTVTEGDTVTLTVTPETGYVLSALTVTDDSGNSVSVTGSGSTYTFSMPSTDATVTATFASGSYSIIITNEEAADDEVYSAYKIFDMTYSGSAYSYTISSDSTFFSVIKDYSNLKDSTSTNTEYFKLTAVDASATPIVYVVEVTTALSTASEYPSDLLAALKAVNLSGISADGSGTLEDGTATITLSSAGYYFVTTTTGSAVMLNSTAPTVLLADKNKAPSVEKKVSDAASGTYDSSNTAAIGDTVYYKAVISNINDASKIVFHDIMSTGLTYENVTSVVYSSDGSTTLQTLTSGSDYTVKTESLTDGCTFEIDFSSYLSSLTTLTDESTLTIYYTAKVNSSAVIESTGNTNDAQVSYGNSSKSTKSTTTTYVYDLYIYKYTGTLGSSETPLSGAKFQLTDDEGNIAYFIYDSTSNKYTLAGWVSQVSDVPANTATVTYTTVITSDATNMIHIEGLKAGVTYTLTETEAPSGYNLLTSTITFMINGSAGSITSITNGTNTTDISATVNSKTNTIAVQNNTGSIIPTTGGMGTTILYIIGAILVITAAVILVTRRRMANK